ncbi:MAG: ROK family protein [Spirochaetes bacterium]|nr:ROK family protein [Spirochaetota bacterium]
MRKRIGFDLGATKMLCGILDEKGTILHRLKRKSVASRKAQDVYTAIVQCIEECLEEASVSLEEIEGIGIGAPGVVNFKKGIVLEAPNLGFQDYPLRKQLEKTFSLPVVVDNDVNLATFAEARKGVAKGMKHVIGLFPGTGLGSGIVLNGELYRGAFGGAGEVGHTIVEPNGNLCGCGGYGHLEALVSRSAIAKDVVALAATGKAPTVLDKAGTDYKKIKSSVLKKAVDAGEKEVEKAILRSAWYLGIGMANLVHILNPEGIVLGGGLVERFGSFYVEAAEASMRKHALPSLVKSVRVLISTFLEDAVVVGAALLLAEELKGKENG